MKILRKLIVLLTMLFIQTANAQRIKNIEGEYTYHVPENVTLDIA